MSMDGGMSIGQPVSAAVGGSAEVVGRTGSTLVEAVGRMTMLTTLINLADTRPTAPAMVVGMPLTDATGQRVEVVGRPGSPLMGMVETVALAGLAVAAIGSMVQSNTAPEPTQEQMRAQAAAQDQQRLTSLSEEDQRKAQALADEERRKAFFNRPKL